MVPIAYRNILLLQTLARSCSTSSGRVPRLLAAPIASSSFTVAEVSNQAPHHLHIWLFVIGNCTAILNTLLAVQTYAKSQCRLPASAASRTCRTLAALCCKACRPSMTLRPSWWWKASGCVFA